jgi:hypothetical protein
MYMNFDQLIIQDYNPISSKGGKRRTKNRRTKTRKTKNIRTRRRNKHSRTKKHY